MPGTNVGSVFFDITANQKPFNTAVGKAASHGQSVMGAAMKKIGGFTAAAFSVTAVLSFGKACIKVASEAESAFKGMQSILEGTGKSVSAAQRYLKEFTADGLVPMTNAVQAYKNLAARGYDTEQIEQVMSRLKDSAAYGRQAAYSYGDAITSATEGLKNENSVLVDNAGVTKNVAKMWEDYAKSVGKTTTALTKQEKVQAEVAGIIEETKWQMGDAAKYADTFAGRQARLSATFQSVKSGIGGIAMAAANQFMPTFQAMADATVNLINRLTALLVSFGVQIPDVTSSVADVGSAALDSAAQTEAIGDAAQSAAKKARKAFAAFDEINVLNTSAGDSTGAADAALGAEAVAALTTTTGEVIKTESAFDSVIAKLKEMGSIFKDGFDMGFGEVDWEGIKGHISGIGASLKAIFTDPNVLDAGKTFGEKLLYNLGRVTGSVASVGMTIAENLLGGVDMYLEQNKERLQTHLIRLFDIGGRISDLYGDYAQAFANVFSVFRSDEAKQVTADLIGIFVEARLGVMEVVGTLGADALQIITTPFVDNQEQIKGVLQGMFTPLHTVLASVKNTIAHTFDEFDRVHKEKVKPAVDGISNTLSGMLKTVLDTYEKWVAPVVNRMANGFKELNEEHIQPFVTKAMELWGSFTQVIDAAFEKVIKPVFDFLVDTIVPLVLPALEGMYNHVKNLFGYILDTAGNIADGWRGIFDVITGVLSGDKDKIKEGLEGIFNAPINQAKDTLHLLEEEAASAWQVLKDGWEGVKNAVGNVFGPTAEKAKAAWGDIKESASEAWGSVKEKAKDALNTIEIDGVGLADAWPGIWEETKADFAEIWDGIKEKASQTWTDIKDFFAPAVTWFKEKWDGIKEGAVNAWAAVMDFFAPVVAWFKERIIDPISNFFSSMWTGIKDMAKGAINGVIGFVNGLMSAVAKGINAVIQAINRLKIDIPEWVPGFGGHTFGFNLPEMQAKQIPLLAQGGYVAANNPQLAIIGDNTREGEIVAPESKIAEAVERGIAKALAGVYGSVAQELAITLVVKYEDGRTIIKKINAAQAAAGQILIEV